VFRHALVTAGVIAVNNIRRVVRQPVMLFTTLALPFMVILVVGSALGGNPNTLGVGVVSHAHDDLAAALVSALRRSTALEVTTYGSDGGLERAVRRGQVDAGIVVPSGYAATLRRGDRSTIRFVITPDQRRAASIRTIFSGILDEQTAALQAALFSHRFTGRDVAAETVRAQRVRDSVQPPRIETSSLAKPPSERLGFAYTAPSNLVLFVLITSLTSSAALIDTRLRGITTRMLALPVGRPSVLLGELLGRLLVALAQAAVILFFSALAFGVAWGDPVGVAAITVALCVFGAALGMVIGFTARTTSQAVAFGPPLGVVLGMLGGCMWPLSIVPDVVRQVGHAVPTAWAMDAYVKLIEDGAPVTQVLQQLGVLTAFAAGMLVLAAAVVQRKTVR
jgi:ABC-2 type transport system permease protein